MGWFLFVWWVVLCFCLCWFAFFGMVLWKFCTQLAPVHFMFPVVDRLCFALARQCRRKKNSPPVAAMERSKVICSIQVWWRDRGLSRKVSLDFVGLGSPCSWAPFLFLLLDVALHNTFPPYFAIFHWTWCVGCLCFVVCVGCLVCLCLLLGFFQWKFCTQLGFHFISNFQ